MSGVVHLHRKVAGSLNLGFLPTYLVSYFFWGVHINSEWRKYKKKMSYDIIYALKTVAGATRTYRQR